MNLHYLCANHRQWLFEDSKRAEQHWLKWIETGIQCYEERRYREAVSFLGCAFEISNHLLDTTWPDTEVAVSRYTYSNICLARAYEQIGETETRHYLLEEADRRLADFYPVANKDSHLSRCKQSLGAHSDSAYWVNRYLMSESLTANAVKAH